MDNTSDLLGIISALGSDPSVMGAISELLKNANGGTPQASPITQSDPSKTADFPQFTAPSSPSYAPTGQFAPPNNGNGINPSSISPELIGTLLSAFGGLPPSTGKGDGCRPTVNGANGDPLSKLLGGKAESENRIRLLNALRPYLSEERRSKLDMILKLLRLAELGKLSGLLNSV